MEAIENIIPDDWGNHLVVALSFYDEVMKAHTFHIPEEYEGLDIADISISKINLDVPLNIRAFFRMCDWLLEQFISSPKTVFSFICSTDPLDNHHPGIRPELYRWNLFDCLYKRNLQKLQDMGIESQNIVVGPEGFQSYARVFYRNSQAPIIHLVVSHLNSKYI